MTRCANGQTQNSIPYAYEHSALQSVRFVVLVFYFFSSRLCLCIATHSPVPSMKHLYVRYDAIRLIVYPCLFNMCKQSSRSGGSQGRVSIADISSKFHLILTVFSSELNL